MKKYIIIISCIIALFLMLDLAYYHLGWHIPINKEKPEYFVKTEKDRILVKIDGEFSDFEIKGVNMGSALPGKWGSDYAIDEDTYISWFGQIKDMGANTVRVYGVQSETFYKAFYNYNKDREKPLYLIQGVLVNDYVQFSHRDAFDGEFIERFADNAKTAVDVIHGRKKIQMGRQGISASGIYNKDVSEWVIGYVLGTDWEPSTVAYTNEKYKSDGLSYNGKYLYTSEDASAFEVMLAEVGDGMIEYETNKYNTQRLIAFSNQPSTDPFTYPEDVARLYMKYTNIDAENILAKDGFVSGQFASYHVYPFQTDILEHIVSFSEMGLDGVEPCYDENGVFNDYRTYFEMLNYHHTLPVVITEFGISSGRGIEHESKDAEGIYSKVSESEQAEALLQCWKDIKEGGCNGGCIFSWQDDWSKHTLNTIYAINEMRNPYWSDYQTNGQYFGLLSFDPGEKESVCYVDGNVSEWTDKDIVSENDGLTLSVKYDEKFVYFLVEKKNLDLEYDTFYIPLDITQKTGSNYCENYGIKFDREVDFLIVLTGYLNSKILVQERYEVLRSTYSRRIYGFDTYRSENVPDKNSPKFVPINTFVEKKVLSEDPLERNVDIPVEAGSLVYGNANPSIKNFNSLADYCAKSGCIEVKIPWQLLNFSDPSNMEIHDDYYDGNYGIKPMRIKEMYAGVGEAEGGRMVLDRVKLKGWGSKVTYHERLKESYYVMKDAWKADD